MGLFISEGRRARESERETEEEREREGQRGRKMERGAAGKGPLSPREVDVGGSLGKISEKVSVLVHFLYTVTINGTFRKFCPCDTAPKSQPVDCAQCSGPVGLWFRV